MDSSDVSTGDDTAENRLWAGLGRIKDPCCALSGRDFSIVDLGLVNRVDYKDSVLEVGITLTDIGCEFAHRIFMDIEALASEVPGIREVRVVPEIFPMWSPVRLSERARAALTRDSTELFRRLDAGSQPSKTDCSNSECKEYPEGLGHAF